MQEPAGRLRARRNSLFSQTVIWITGLICMAFLLGTLAQAWSNSYLMQKVQNEQQILQQQKDQHNQLQQAAEHYKDPTVIENEARQQLGYVRPGEQSVIIINTNGQNHQTAQQRKSAASAPDYWQEWWQAFFGN
jgi:cell division protein FtsB